MKIKCNHCGKTVHKSDGHANRAIKLNARMFCDKKCFGLFHRKGLSEAEKKEVKRLYDIEYRKRNADKVKARAIAYNESPAGRAMQKRQRVNRKDKHLDYCRTEKYRLGYKQSYDKQYHAKQKYGDYYESAIILHDLETLIQPEVYEAKYNSGLLNKSQKRKRKWNSMQKI